MPFETRSPIQDAPPTQPLRRAPPWRLLGYLLSFILVNLLANLARVESQALGAPPLFGSHTASDWVAINLGLGVVVLGDRHLLQIDRTVPLFAEDLLGTFAVGMCVLTIVDWAWRSRRRFEWRGTLAEDGQPAPRI